MSELIRLTGLGKSFPQKFGNAVTILQDIDLTIGQGETVCVLGESGCGKTTLGKIIAGLSSYTAGSYQFEGQEVSQLKGESWKKFRSSVQLIHQNPYESLNPALMVFDIIANPIRRHQKIKNMDVLYQKVTELLETVGLTPVEDFVDKYPSFLSGGQRQRVSIARILAMDPKLIVVDEATSMIDTSLRISLLGTLKRIQEERNVGELALPGVSRGTKYITGLGDTMTENWVDVSKLNNYETDTEKASQLLESAGLTQKDDGQWYLESGKQFTLDLQCPTAWSDASTAASEIAQQLTTFGIKTTVSGIDSTMRQNNISNGDYQIALSFFGTGQPHPMFAYETPLLVSNVNASKGLGYSMIQDTEAYGQVDLNQLIIDSTAGWDVDAQKEAVEKIAVTVNEKVPYLPIYTKWSKYITSNGMRTDWGSDDSLYQNSAGDDNFAVIKILNGELGPKA